MNLALFDLDNTLLAGDSDFEWGQFLIDKQVWPREFYESRNQAFYDQYKAGTLDIHEFLAFQLKPLATHPRATLDAWHAEFMERVIRPMISDAARELVKRHLDAGDLAIVITATNSFVTGPIARELGVPHLIATEPEEGPAGFTGRPAGTPCFREGKVERLADFLTARGSSLESYPRSHFYSDSHNDLPLLLKVSDPVAVDPDPKLAAEARSRGWPILHIHPEAALER